MKRLFLLLIGFMMLNLCFPQTPNWIEFNNRSLLYPKSKYYIGFVENTLNKDDNSDEKLNQLKEQAASNISSNIRLNVESLTTSIIQETNHEFTTQFKKSIASYSNIDLVGLQYKTHISEKEHRLYVLAIVEKATLNSYYQNKFLKTINELDLQVKKAESFFVSSNVKQAIIEYHTALQIVTECNSIQSVLLAMGITPKQELKTESLINLNQQLNNLLLKIESGSNRTVSDLAAITADAIVASLTNNASLKIAYLTFADTKFTSPFSKQFAEALKPQLVNKGLAIVEEGETNTLLLKGNYWDEADNLRISVSVIDNSGKIYAASDNIIQKKYLIDNGISFKAENFTDAYVRMQEFRKDEIVSGDMVAEIWTDKGKDNLLYKEGEIMKLFVRVNTASYLRVVYYLADGSKVLLLDNYYIDQTKINKVIEIPDQFECASPFGYETLQLFAQSKSFTALQTQEQYGYQFITQNTSDIVVNARGFKKVTNLDKKAEVRLNITTYK